jgi:DNA-directed RNA polymerase subunit RPC12/RpoP
MEAKGVGPLTQQQKAVFRVGGVVVVVALFAYSARSLWTSARQPSGSEKDAITLVCAKCDQETALPSAEYKKLSRDPQTGAVQCPKCGEKAARIATSRCPKCGRAFPPQPRDAARVCPFCKASLSGDDEEP